MHYKAYDVFAGNVKEDKTVSLKEIINLDKLSIKNDRGLKRLKNA